MILDIYKDSLEYGIKDGKTLLKFGVMLVLSIFIIPLFLALGYDYRIIKTAVNGQINGGDELPEMNDLISMFVDGLKLFAVELVYIIVPVAVFLILTYLGSFLGGISPVAGQIVTIIGTVLGIVLGVISYILMNLAFGRLADTDSLEEAFNIRALWDTACEIGWLRLIGFFLGLLIILAVIAFIVALFFFFILGLFAGTIGLITVDTLFAGGILLTGTTIIYIIMNLIVAPYLSIVQYRAIGLLYNLRF